MIDFLLSDQLLPFSTALAIFFALLMLEIGRRGEQALIIKDRMRVDANAEFYVSVAANEDAIARAAQTLGDRTFDVAKLRDMIEGKLVDALRSVAARMTMDELHENRSDFVQQVSTTVEVDLTKNGLELESVALTGLDQTPFDNLDPNNAFNAEGMQKLAEKVALSRKAVAETEAEANASVAESEKQGAIRTLQTKQEEEEARIVQEQYIAQRRAASRAEIAQREEDATRASEAARIARERDVQVAQQEREIMVAQKSEEESLARGKADDARALAIEAEESVVTTRVIAQARREKEAAVIEAQQEAEVNATSIKVQAQAEREAAENRAIAVREGAQAESDADTLRAVGTKAKMYAEAEGRKAIVEAENAQSADLLEHHVRIAEYKMMPLVAEQLVKPAEKIESIRMNYVNGLGNDSNTVGNGGGTDLAGAILRTAGSLPAFKELGEQFAMTLSDEAAIAIGAPNTPLTEETDQS